MRWSLLCALVWGSCAGTASPALPEFCSGVAGGREGAQTQLRFIEATDRQIVLTFGPSAASDAFGVPAFDLVPLEGTSAARAYRLRVRGTSTLNPDGTRSYHGLSALEPGGRTVRGVTFVDEDDRGMTFTVTLESDACPYVGGKAYQYGKSPRAQIALTFRGASSLAVETVSDVVGGAPAGTPAQVTGVGYTPGAKVRLSIGGRWIHQTTVDADGTFDTGIWIPDREPGLYEVAATDGRGRRGVTTIRVMARRTIFPRSSRLPAAQSLRICTLPPTSGLVAA